MPESRSSLAAWALALALPLAAAAQTAENESWQVHQDFDKLRPTTIAVLPMDNLSLEPGVEDALWEAVYSRLKAKGYTKVSGDHVSGVMKRLGVTIPGLLSGFSPARLGSELHADALLFGQIEQSARIMNVGYDAVVVSCSLRLVHAQTGAVLWHAEQWRAARRQWQIDPVNMLLNALTHSTASREERVAFLVQEMLKTLPEGPIETLRDNLLEKARVIGQ